jgi:hypothetical protein
LIGRKDKKKKSCLNMMTCFPNWEGIKSREIKLEGLVSLTGLKGIRSGIHYRSGAL